MRDIDVRLAVNAKLNEQHCGDPDTVIYNEMGVWSSTVRIDIAVVNGELHGFELKSARDTLVRLSSQADIYNMVFDRITLVAATKHIAKSESIIPSWWGIASVIPTESGPLKLIEKRKADINPSISPRILARMLWKDELLALLSDHDLIKGYRSKPISALADRAASELSIDTLRASVRKALKARKLNASQSIST